LTEDEELLLIYIHPGIYLRELQQMLYSSTGCMVDASTICRAVHRCGMTRQRIKHVSLKQSDTKRLEFQAEMSAFVASTFLWIDETGFNNRNAIRKYGYGIRGQPPQDRKRYSAIGILSVEGVQDVYLTEDSVDGEKCAYFLQYSLLPIIMPFDGRNHNRELLTGVGVLIRLLPAYSPDLNLIVFTEVKQYLQANSSLLNTTIII
jgi:hypothetical protein